MSKIKETLGRYKSHNEPFTYDDYVNLPDDHRYEILEGELVMAPSPVTVHQRVSRRLVFKLIEYVEQYGLGEIFQAPYDVKLSETTVVQPDVVFVSTANSHIVTEENIKGVPDLVVEIISHGTAKRNTEKKKDIYEKYGVGEYWIIQPQARWAEIYTLQRNKYRLHRQTKETGKLDSVVIKGFEIEFDSLF